MATIGRFDVHRPMKLATYHDGSRDGHLVVVSRDLATAHFATGIATRLQQVLDDWNFLSPQLEDLAATLNGGKARHAFAFDPARCMAPLPRAYRWVLVAPAADAIPVHGAGDGFVGAADAARGAVAGGAAVGIAALTGDVEAGAAPVQAVEGVRLLALFAAAAGGEPVAFAPVAVTPDELGDGWRDARVWLEIEGAGAAGEAGPGFGAAIAHLAAARPVRAGSIVGQVVQASCGVEARRFEVRGRDGLSVFGAITLAPQAA